MINKIILFLEKSLRAIISEPLILQYDSWQRHKQRLAQTKSIEESIKIIERRWPILENNISDNPIFIFAAGWRSGSTLLQRLVMSDNRVIIWGEPFANCNLIQLQAESIKAIQSKYPANYWFLNSIQHSSPQELIAKNIPNLYPEFKYLFQAHQNLLLTLYAESAISQGYSRWGLKEVRLNMEHAIYLKWLFPQAKIIFLYRDPYKSYLSLRPHFKRWSLYERWLNNPIDTPFQFGLHWKNLVKGYVENHSKVDGLLIKYEDLCSGKFHLKTLAEYLDIEIQEEVLANKVGNTKKEITISPMEKTILKKTVDPLAQKLGYMGDN